MITLGSINISDKTKNLMSEALNQGIIGQGKYIEEFEKKLADFLGVKYIITTANGTLADASALAAAKYKDTLNRNEVIVPALTFVAQVNAVYYNHLVHVFVDVGYDYQIDVKKIEEKINEKTLAIMPTHLLGRPSKMKEIFALAKKYNLFVIEDSCEALGSKYENQFCGTIGDMGCFSFFPSHTITTGEGGAIATNDDDFADILYSIRNHGRKSNRQEEKFIFPYIGFSAKMNCMEAIIGLGIIDEFSKYLERRRENMINLNKFLKKDWFVEQENEHIIPHAFPIMTKTKENRDKMLLSLYENFGIEARQIFYSIPTQSQAYRFLNEKVGTYPVAEDIGERGLYVPCHQNLSDEDIVKIAEALKQVEV